ncbi:MAG: NAD(+) synthase [Porphyromonadaceae bacterium]|nr:NAD(+) synthase [Porphyromonadaceae bacterium]
MKHGFVKVAAGVPFVKVADCAYNVERIECLIREAETSGVEILTFPELCITGYTCGDLFLQPFLIEEAERNLISLVERTKDTKVLVLVGMPMRVEEKLFNAAVAFQSGRILGAIPKTYLPNYREFQEARWFSPAKDLQFTLANIGDYEVPIGHNLLFRSGHVAIGIEICEDMWTPYTPGTRLALNGAHIIFNLSASNESIGKHAYLRSLISGLSSQSLCGYVYCSCGYGESSTDLVYTGKAFVAEIGRIMQEMPRFVYEERLLINDIDIDRIQSERLTNSSFKASVSAHTQRGLLTEIPFELRSAEESQEINRHIEQNPFLPADQREVRCAEVLDIQICALSQRLRHVGARQVVLGISGGLDSTLALLSTVATFDFMGLPRTGIIGVTMPGMGTSKRTKSNALKLMQALKITALEIDITAACLQHFADIGHDPSLQDVTYENSQARERTQILMDLANKHNALVIGTGDLSELALGWCTFNGDHMSMYSINAGLPKTSIQHIVRYLAETNYFGTSVSPTLISILDTPISPELTGSTDGDIEQKTEDILGPYEVHDFVMYNFLAYGYSPSKIHYLASVAFNGVYTLEQLKHWMSIFYHRFFSQQFKRNCMPDGPKVSRISLSPRGDWRMPSDAIAKAWLAEVDRLPI